MDSFKQSFSTAKYNGKIWTFGGYVNDKSTDIVQSFDFEKMIWLNQKALPVTSCDHSSVVIDNIIYVTPGSTGNTNMFRFDVITRESVVLETEIDNINYAFSTSKYDGQIWTFGGCVNGKIVDIVQSFDFEKMIWFDVITKKSAVLKTEIDNINYAFSTSKYNGQIWTFGGCVNGKIVDIVQSFDFEKMIWFDVITRESVVLETEIDNINYAFSTSKYDGQIWTFGGCVNGKIVDIVQSFDFEKMIWFDIVTKRSVVLETEMDSFKQSFSTAKYNGKIWTFGGYVNDKSTDIVQSFDFEKMIWLNQKALPVTSCDHSSVVIDNIIYVTPGSTGNTNMFRYDPRIKDWEKLAEIPIKRQNSAVCLNDNNIMFCGGVYQEGEKWTKKDNCDIYEINANKWQSTTPLPITCSGNRSVELSTEIISFGGSSNSVNISDIYSFDKKTEIWTKSNIALPSPNMCPSLSYY
uniref:Kelch repeat protein n=1 Tax=Rhabditophanes sp. KR3021 TaxID=114890 RepID=A0AC35UAF3_9BILA